MVLIDLDHFIMSFAIVDKAFRVIARTSDDEVIVTNWFAIDGAL